MNNKRFLPGKGVTLIVLSLFCLALPASIADAAVQPVSVVNGMFAPPAGGNGDSSASILSPDGRYVLFASLANNLTVNSNGIPFPTLTTPRLNVFLRDRTNQTTTLVSVNFAVTDGGNRDSSPTAISTNGQFALFESTSTDFLSNNPATLNETNQIYRRDVVNGVTTLISASTDGGNGNGTCRSSVMTPDGRYIAFVSAANNLVAGDTNGIADVFLYDAEAETTTLVSVGAEADSGNLPGSSELPQVSTNGRYVAFYSTAQNVVAGAPINGEIFLRDMNQGATTWISAGAHAIMYSLEGTSNALCCNFSLSPDGQYVAYEACALSNATFGDVNYQNASVSLLGGIILSYSLATGLTTVVNTNALGVLSGSELNTRNIDMTPDGRFVAFVANVGTTYGQTCVEVWDSLSNTTTVASVNSSGAIPATSMCYWPAMDSTGRYVAFLANASNLTSNSPASGFGLFLRDMQAGVTTWLDSNSYGTNIQDNVMTFPRLTTNGCSVAFESLGEGLVANDSNDVYNVFVRDVSAGTTELISAHAPSLPSISADGASTISLSSVSTNGRYVAFSSGADNLVSVDTNGCPDVFVRDILSGVNYLVSVNTNGIGSGNGLSVEPAISGNGRYVVFTSSASNLVANDTNNATDVFLRDLEANTTTLVSVNTNGNGPGNSASRSPSISADGRYVLFESAAGNLAPGSVNDGNTFFCNLYWRDTLAGVTEAITAEIETNFVGEMTPDGQYVAYESSISSTVYLWSAQAGKRIYTNTQVSIGGPLAISPTGTRMAYYGMNQIWAVDSVAKTSVGIGPVPTNSFYGVSSHDAMQFSADSQYLVYVGRPSGSSNQIYLYSYTTGSNILISQSYTNSATTGNGNSDSPTISSDGLYVAYRSLANNLVPGGTAIFPNIYLYSRLAGTTTLLTADMYGYGAANNRSLTPAFSGAGETLVFESWATDLAAGAYSQWGNIYAFQPFSSSATNSNGSFAIQNFGFSSLGWQNESGLAPSFTWLTAPGISYQVQYTTNLADPAWQDLTNNVSVVGGEGYAIDLAPGSTQKFYRVVGVP